MIELGANAGQLCGCRWRGRFLSWSVFIVLLSTEGAFAGGKKELSFTFEQRSIFKIGKESFDLATETGVEKLGRRAEEILGSESNSRKEKEEPENQIAKRDIRGLKQISRLARRHSEEHSEPIRTTVRQEIGEIASAMANNHRSPVPSYVGLPDFPFRLAAALNNPVARGNKPASNIATVDAPSDLSAIDPAKSSYWQRPSAIPEIDLYAGFGRTEVPRFDDYIWSYAGAKKGGRNPGCDLASGSQRIQVKFAEMRSEPFISRIFYALGYNVDPSDFASQLRIRYDRRWFTEFNMRPEIKMKIGVFFIPIYTFHFEKSYEPFLFIDHAVMKDGSTVPGADLKKLLLRDTARKRAELIAENFRTEVESQIELLVTTSANVQTDHIGSRNIGPWDFSGLGREHLREVRGAGVLAAWLGWWDTRFDNTRLRVVKTGAAEELQHFFSDLGNGLGRSRGTFWHSSEEPNDFTWSFTAGRPARRNGKETWHFGIKDFEPLTETPAFKEITLDDARWMARLIAQLSEEQITGALIASGFDSADVRIYTEKLLARRDQLIRDVRLATEFPMLRPEQQNHEMNYDPIVDGPVATRTKSGVEVQAPAGASIVRRGRVKPRDKAED